MSTSDFQISNIKEVYDAVYDNIMRLNLELPYSKIEEDIMKMSIAIDRMKDATEQLEVVLVNHGVEVE